ncbi:MAG: EamA family transporter [Streptosporangiaceae bacterium]
MPTGSSNGRAIPRASWLALALALVMGVAGVGILARPHGHGSVVPALIVLGGSLSWGTGSVLAGRLPAPARPLLGSAMEMLAGGAVLAGLAAMTGELGHLDPSQVSGRSVLALLYLIGPGSLLAMTCYVIALRGLPTAAVSTYAYLMRTLGTVGRGGGVGRLATRRESTAVADRCPAPAPPLRPTEERLHIRLLDVGGACLSILEALERRPVDLATASTSGGDRRVPP